MFIFVPRRSTRVRPEIGFACDWEAQNFVIEPLRSFLVFDRNGNDSQAIADGFLCCVHDQAPFGSVMLNQLPELSFMTASTP
jgi:hypothetical protein